jgi:hypothetical protein
MFSMQLKVFRHAVKLNNIKLDEALIRFEVCLFCLDVFVAVALPLLEALLVLFSDL